MTDETNLSGDPSPQSEGGLTRYMRQRKGRLQETDAPQNKERHAETQGTEHTDDLTDVRPLGGHRQDLVQAHRFATAVAECVPVPMVVLEHNCSVRWANRAFRNLTNLRGKELEGRSLPELANLLWGIESMWERLQSVLDNPATPLEYEHESQTAQKKTLLIKGDTVRIDGDRVLLLTMEDITLRRQAEHAISGDKQALETEIRRTTYELDRTKDELRGLTSHLFKVQEEERERIARELHDDISQRLSLLEILLTPLPGSAGGNGPAIELDAARNELRTLNTDIRQLSHQLHPSILKDLGLSTALRALVEEFERREGIPTTFSSSDLPRRLREDASTAIYRVTQEALRNIAKHAGKTHANVLLQVSGNSLELKVVDFGSGFDSGTQTEVHGLGIISMQERARIAGGRFKIQSSRGAGTTITVSIPVES